MDIFNDLYYALHPIACEIAFRLVSYRWNFHSNTQQAHFQSAETFIGFVGKQDMLADNINLIRNPLVLFFFI